MRTPARSIVGIALAAALAWAPSQEALAQTYPSKPIQMVVPFPAGGGTDIVARIVASEMTRELGQSVVVENKGGANGIIGAEFVAKAAPDGYTIVMSTMGNFAINPAIYRRMPFSVAKDLEPITQVVSVPLMLVVHPSVPARTVAQFIAYTKAQKNPVSYASSGAGGGPHLAGELFASATGANMLHVPYKGSGPAYTDLLGGHVAADFDSLVQGLQYVRAGQLRALAILSPRRSELLPDVPTMSEAVPGYDVTNWYGMMAAAGTPLAIRRQLQQAVARVMAKPEIQRRLVTEGVEPVASTPEEFGRFLADETERWAAVVKRAGIEPQ